MEQKSKNGVSIIGGADGPTSIFILVKIAVEIYCIGKGLINLILGFMLIGTLLWYRQWERFALLAVAGGILLFFLWLGIRIKLN